MLSFLIGYLIGISVGVGIVLWGGIETHND